MDLLTDGPDDSASTVILAHGAGAPMDSPFMNVMARGLAGEGIRVVRFEFPYMAGRRNGGKRRPPDREPQLRQAWREVAASQGDRRLIIGGKSMGGRIASMEADALGVRGLLCLGYPFHPPGKPEQLRTAHLAALSTPALFLQGSRDVFGSREEVTGYRLSDSIRLVWMEEGDHSFKTRKGAPATERENLAQAVREAAAFVRKVS